jgi:nucleotide-binding universal stress UspA family protein
VATEVRIAQQTDVAQAICDAANKFGADLVCIGRSGLAAAVLGSVASAVINRSACPVLVVRPPRA